MNLYLLTAGCIAFILAIVHSVLGELKVFRNLNNSVLPPLNGFPILWKNDRAAKQTLRMVWHLTTVLALCIVAILLHLSYLPSLSKNEIMVVKIICASMFLSFLVSLIVSKGSHVSWMAFLIIGILCALSFM